MAGILDALTSCKHKRRHAEAVTSASGFTKHKCPHTTLHVAGSRERCCADTADSIFNFTGKTELPSPHPHRELPASSSSFGGRRPYLFNRSLHGQAPKRFGQSLPFPKALPTPVRAVPAQGAVTRAHPEKARAGITVMEPAWLWMNLTVMSSLAQISKKKVTMSKSSNMQ